MLPYLSDFFSLQSPEMMQEYERGFRAGRDSALREIRSAMKKAEKLPAFTTYTATASPKDSH